MPSHPFIPAPGTVRCEVQFLLNGQQAENVIHVTNGTSAWTPADMVLLGDAFGTWVAGSLVGALPNNCVYIGTKVTDLSTSTSGTYFSTLNTGVAGTNGAPLPNNVSFAVHKVTAGRGKSASGRVFVPGLYGAALVGPNTVTSAYGSGICTAYNALRAQIADAIPTAVMSILSLRTGNAWRAAGVVFTVLDFVCRDFIVDSSRRRLPGRGR